MFYHKKVEDGSRVDVILIEFEHKMEIQKYKSLLSNEFEMKDLGVASRILALRCDTVGHR